MRELGSSRVIDALADWGTHEAAGRWRGREAPLPAGDVAAAADFALRNRAPFVALILSHEPRGVVTVELEPQDADLLVLADGRNLEQWIAQADADSRAHFEQLRDAETPPQGPLVLAVLAPGPSPLVVFDGWHRSAAWFERCRGGRPSNLSAHLLIWTKP